MLLHHSSMAGNVFVIFHTFLIEDFFKVLLTSFLTLLLVIQVDFTIFTIIPLNYYSSCLKVRSYLRENELSKIRGLGMISISVAVMTLNIDGDLSHGWLSISVFKVLWAMCLNCVVCFFICLNSRISFHNDVSSMWLSHSFPVWTIDADSKERPCPMPVGQFGLTLIGATIALTFLWIWLIFVSFLFPNVVVFPLTMARFLHRSFIAYLYHASSWVTK